MLEAALIDFSVDSDGDFLVNESIRCVVIPNREHRDRISLMAQYGFEDGVSEEDRLTCVNRINQEYILVRASVTDRSSLRFRYDIYLPGGMTPKNIVMTLKRFCSVCKSAVSEYEKLIQ